MAGITPSMQLDCKGYLKFIFVTLRGKGQLMEADFPQRPSTVHLHYTARCSDSSHHCVSPKEPRPQEGGEAVLSVSWSLAPTRFLLLFQLLSFLRWRGSAQVGGEKRFQKVSVFRKHPSLHLTFLRTGTAEGWFFFSPGGLGSHWCSSETWGVEQIYVSEMFDLSYAQGVLKGIS